jgi:hypothetical protein
MSWLLVDVWCEVFPILAKFGRWIAPRVLPELLQLLTPPPNFVLK